MSDKNNIRGNRVKQFFRYHHNHLTGTERNSFERELQKDPFSEEAMEGFKLLSPSESSEDISELQRRLRSRIDRKQKYVIYGIAASIALTLAVSSLIILSENNRSRKNIALNTLKSEPIEIGIDKPITSPATENIAPAKQKSEKNETGKAAGAEQPNENVEITTESRESAVPGKVANINAIKSEGKNKLINVKSVRSRLSEPAALSSSEKRVKSYQAEGQVISSEDDLPVPGASVHIKDSRSFVITNPEGHFKIALPDSSDKTLIVDYIGMRSKEFLAKADSEVRITLDPDISALDEVVVVGNGTKSESENDLTGYIPAHPVNGYAEFNRYIKENIPHPDKMTEKKAVVLSFLVHTDGSLDSFRIVRSPDKKYSDEAVRLIKSGPAWDPAMEDGKIKEERIRLRILFR